MNGKHIATCILLAVLLSGCGPAASETVSTQLIADALIYDGSGSEPFDGNLRFDSRTGRIVAVGDLAPMAGETVIDAKGLVLAPGFIDTHSHHDEELEEFRQMPGVLSQGVTTIARGMDGFTYAGSVGEFNASFAQSPAAVNVASFSAHNTIRLKVMEDDFQRHASDEEIDAMAALVKADMESGAFGLSTGLEYEPGIYSSTDEVIKLARIAAQFDGIYASHVRDEDDQFIEAAQEIIDIGREAGLPVRLTHIKIADRLALGSAADVIALMDAARAEGVDITADIYPYERWASNIAILFPDRDFTNVEHARFTFERTAEPADILVTEHPADPELAGKTIDEISRILELDHVETLLDLAQSADTFRRETGQDSQIIVKSMIDDDIRTFMQWSFTMICSDGWHGGHPRGYGAFPRVLGRYVREQGVLTLPEAVYKMSGLTADYLGISDRGRIAAGKFADLVLFDPDTIIDNATMQDPTALSSGVAKVWVNGQLAFSDGQPTGVFAGQVIRRAE